jgi:hypothetical protein
VLIEELGFHLQTRLYIDALCARYEWQFERLPSHCTCGSLLSLDHALGCSKGAMPSIRHNRIRDIIAQFMTEVCLNVATEPVLMPLTGEIFRLRTTSTNDNARLDIKAQDFWDCSKRGANFDVRVFNSHAPSNCDHEVGLLPLAWTGEEESIQGQGYQCGTFTFTPLAFPTSGGWGPCICHHRSQEISSANI